MSLTTTSLDKFVEEVKADVVGQLLFDQTTADMDGVKTQDNIVYSSLIYNIDDAGTVNTGLGAGYADVDTAGSDVTLTKRNLNVETRTLQNSISLKQLAQYGIGADLVGTEEAAAGVVKDIIENAGANFKRQNEIFTWGAGSGSAHAVSLTDTAIADGTDLATAYGTSAFSTGSSESVDTLIDAVTAENADMAVAEDVIICMSIVNFNKYRKALQDKNGFHFDVRRESRGLSITHPTMENVSIMGLFGMGAYAGAVITTASNIVVGLNSPADLFEGWYDANTQTFRYRLQAELGANYRRADRVFYIADLA